MTPLISSQFKKIMLMAINEAVEMPVRDAMAVQVLELLGPTDLGCLNITLIRLGF